MDWGSRYLMTSKMRDYNDRGRHHEYLGPVRGLLLCVRHPQRWRDALRLFLNDYIMEEAMKDTLHFLINIIMEARTLKLRAPNAVHLVRVEADTKPVVFPLDRWRHLMISLGFMLEEPDVNQDLRLCSVYVHGTVRLPMLSGLLALLNSLKGLTVHVIRWLLQMAEENALLLLSAVTEVLEGRLANLGHWIRPLWDWHQPLLESLGYRRIVHQQHVHYTYGHAHPSPGQERADLSRVQAVLLGMYGTVSDVVQETAV